MSKDLTEALRRLTEDAQAPAQPVEPMKNRSAAGAAKSAALNNNGKPGTGGGIASPLTEVSFASRTYWADKNYTSTDGLITLVLKPIKRVSLLDANGESVLIDYKSP